MILRWCVPLAALALAACQTTPAQKVEVRPAFRGPPAASAATTPIPGNFVLVTSIQGAKARHTYPPLGANCDFRFDKERQIAVDFHRATKGALKPVVPGLASADPALPDGVISVRLVSVDIFWHKFRLFGNDDLNANIEVELDLMARRGKEAVVTERIDLDERSVEDLWINPSAAKGDDGLCRGLAKSFANALEHGVAKGLERAREALLENRNKLAADTFS